MTGFRLIKGGRWWLVRSESFRGAFGTDTLPTAFGTAMPPSEVIDRLRALGTDIDTDPDGDFLR